MKPFINDSMYSDVKLRHLYWDILNRPEVVYAMEAFVHFQMQPVLAVEPLLLKFGLFNAGRNNPGKERDRMCIGSMVCQIMESLNHPKTIAKVQIETSEIFTTAQQYEA